MIKIYDMETLEEREILFRGGSGADVSAPVAEILRAVQERGDAALREYTLRFDGAAPDALAVTAEEVDQAAAQVEPAFLAVLEEAAEHIRAYHARHPLGPYQHWLAQEHPAVDGAHSVEFQIAVVGDLADHEPNLVHVGGEEKLAAGMFPALFPGNQVAQSVHPQPVCVWLHLRQE